MGAGFASYPPGASIPPDMLSTGCTLGGAKSRAQKLVCFSAVDLSQRVSDLIV